MPDYYRCSVARPVSCYALFKGIAASKLTSWLSKQLNRLWSTYRRFRDLSCWSGLFPSRPWTLAPKGSLPSISDSIRSSSGFGRLWHPLVLLVALPLSDSTSRLLLKAFRGVRAISEFDWPFTPTHNSSKHFSTWTGSVLHAVLPALQPGHG